MSAPGPRFFSAQSPDGDVVTVKIIAAEVGRGGHLYTREALEAAVAKYNERHSGGEAGYDEEEEAVIFTGKR